MRKYSATTVKLESAVVREVYSVLEPGQTLTSYVRDTMVRDIRNRKLRNSANLYRDFLRQYPEETNELVEWEQVDLAKPPTMKKKRTS